MSSPPSPDPAPGSARGNLPHPAQRSAIDRYWRRVLMLTGTLLLVWFVAGPVLGILLADPLNEFRIGGIPLGFWFAQQGSIIIFVLLILIYALVMNHLDKQYRREIARSARDGEVRP